MVMQRVKLDECGSWQIPQLQEHLARADEIVVSSSGSGGFIKQVLIEKAAFTSATNLANQFLDAKTGQTWSLLLPTTHIAGANVLLRANALNTTVIDNRNTDKYKDADFVSVVPTQIHQAISNDKNLLQHLKNAKRVLVGAAALSLDLASKAKNQGINLVTTYGMSETCGGIVYDGSPLPNVKIEIRSDIIYLSTPTLASGYINQPELWRSAYIDGWFKTNDLGNLKNNRLTVIGRNDDLIISGGEKISTIEIDNFLAKKYTHCQFKSFGITDSKWGQILCLAMDKKLPLSDLLDLLSSTFPKYYLPKRFFYISEIPKTALGKFDRNLIENMISKKELLEIFK